MEKADLNICKLMFALTATLLQFLFGGWTLPIKILVAAISLDIITGVLAASKRGKGNSKAFEKGLKHKIGIFVLVALAHLIDKVIGTSEPIIQTATIYWYVGKEGFSIMENAGKIGVPLPTPLIKALEQLNEDKEQ